MDTHVAFRKFPEGDVIALFPGSGGTMIDSYQHLGQHSRAHISLMHTLEEAGPEEYEDLKTEMEGIGYCIKTT